MDFFKKFKLRTLKEIADADSAIAEEFFVSANIAKKLIDAAKSVGVVLEEMEHTVARIEPVLQYTHGLAVETRFSKSNKWTIIPKSTNMLHDWSASITAGSMTRKGVFRIFNLSEEGPNATNQSRRKGLAWVTMNCMGHSHLHNLRATRTFNPASFSCAPHGSPMPRKGEKVRFTGNKRNATS